MRSFIVLAVVLFLYGCIEPEYISTITVHPYGIRVTYYNDPLDPNIKIYDSAGIICTDDMIHILDFIMADPLYTEVQRTRTLISYLTEWRAHNWLYERNISPECTIDVDLEEHEAKGRLYAYFILSILYGSKA